MAWFGIDLKYRGMKMGDGEPSIASVLFATLEARAREHPDSKPDMPLTLAVDRDSKAAVNFWKYQGFGWLEDLEVQEDGARYIRLIRGASEA